MTNDSSKRRILKNNTDSYLLRKWRSGGQQFKANPGKKLARPVSTNKVGVVAGTCGPSYRGCHRCEAGLRENARPHLKNSCFS
jgi:hypothetical protein